MTPILIDTGVIVALLDRSERHHERCVEAVRTIAAPLVTCEAVIAESCYLLRSVCGAAEAVLQNVERGTFTIPFRLNRSYSAVRVLLRRYARVPMDLADACLVCLADELSTGTILTLDADFTMYRWRRNRSFENLITLG